MMCFLDFADIFKDNVSRFAWKLLILNVSYLYFIWRKALVIALYASVKSGSTSTWPTVQSQRPALCPCSWESARVSSSTFPSSCQCCQHWSVRKDFSWQNFEAPFWHPQQTNCCLLPSRALWSPNELVSSQEMRKGTHKINLSGY